MIPCPQSQDEALSLLAAGALESDAEARLRTHLTSCSDCRRELEALQSVLGLVALPPPSAREQALLAPLPQRAVGAWHRAQLQRASRLRTAGALMVAAAGVLLALGPVVQSHLPRPPGPRTPTPVTAPEEGRELLDEVTVSPSSEETLELQQWALADPLADALEPADTEGAETWSDPEDLEAEDPLSNPYLGDSP